MHGVYCRHRLNVAKVKNMIWAVKTSEIVYNSNEAVSMVGNQLEISFFVIIFCLRIKTLSLAHIVT
jgi:hypothetical protein